MKIKQYKIEEVSPDKEVVVAFSIAINKNLNGSVNEISFGLTSEKPEDPTELKANTVFVSGQYDLVRPKLHAMLDDILESCQFIQEQNDRFDKMKTAPLHREEGKPMVWNPGGVS